MSLPKSYYPPWWNICDNRTSHFLGNKMSYVKTIRSQAGGRCVAGHFGRVAACCLNFENGHMTPQYSPHLDIFPTSLCVPLYAGASKNGEDVVLGRQKDDYDLMNKIASSLVACSAMRGSFDAKEKVMRDLKESIMNRNFDDSVRLSRLLSERTSHLLQDHKAAEMMWNEERLSTSLNALNYKFSGGCLVPFELNGGTETMLLHPGGRDLTTLKCCVYNRSKRLCEPQDRSLNIASTICEIDCVPSVRPSPNIVVRDLSGDLTFVRIDDADLNVVQKKKLDSIKQTNSVRLSPHSFSDFLVGADSKCVLFDLESSTPVYKSPVFNSCVHSFYEWCFCDFTNNLWNLVFFDNSQLRLVDTRQPAGSTELYSITNASINTPGERFTSLISNSNILDNYHIISSTNNMILLDQRMAQKPVLHWTNSLLGHPCISFASKESKQNLLWYIAGSQKMREFSLHCLNLRIEESMAPQLLGVTVGGSPVSFMDSLPNDVCRTLISGRFEKTSLLSVCALPHNDGQSVDCVLLFSNGDLSRQSFSLESSSSEAPVLDLSVTESTETLKWFKEVVSLNQEHDTRPETLLDNGKDMALLSRLSQNESGDHLNLFSSYSNDESNDVDDGAFGPIPNERPVNLNLFLNHIGGFAENRIVADAHSQILAFGLEKFLQEAVGGVGNVIEEEMSEDKLNELKKKRVKQDTARMLYLTSEKKKVACEADVLRACKKMRKVLKEEC